MKKLIILICLLCAALIFPGFIFVLSGPPAGGGGSCTGACTTQTDSETDTTTGHKDPGKYAGSKWYATKFTASTTGDICKVVLYAAKTGTPSDNLDVYIYSDNSDQPGTQIGTGDSLGPSSFGSAEGEVAFTNVCASVTSGTSYWIVAKTDVDDSSNYYSWYYEDNGAVEHIMYSSDGSSWSTSLTTSTLKYILYE